MASFDITRRNGDKYTVLVDDSDLQWVLARGKWKVVVDKKRKYTSVERTLYLGKCGGKYRTGAERLARVILNAPEGVEVDHKNRNTLDNRRENLRLCTRSQNVGNTVSRITSTTGLKGVMITKHGKFQARIRFEGAYYHLGTFETAAEAHEAYIKQSQKLRGDFHSDESDKRPKVM